MDFPNNINEIHPNINEQTPGRQFLAKLLNKSMKIQITDGRYLIGTFVCTDMQSNVILASCQEFIDENTDSDPKKCNLLFKKHTV